MANEITASVGLKFVKGTADIELRFSGVTADVTGTKYIQNRQTIGTLVAEQLEIGDITTPGIMVMKNLAASGSVSFRDGAGGADVVMVKAGEICMFRPDISTIFAIGTISSEIEYLLIED